MIRLYSKMEHRNVLNFERRWKKLYQSIESSQNPTVSRKEYDDLVKILSEMAPSLSPFDKERYYSQVDRLLKQIDEQSSLKDSKGTKMFQFQKKPKLKERASSVIKNIQDEKKSCAVSNEVVKVKDSTAIYENLNDCTLTTAADMRSSSSGSFILRKATKTLVCLKPPNFQTGSVFISDCANSIILCDTAPNNGIQIRLHNLTDCKLWICPTDSSSKQIVVLENCSKCVFHKSTKERVEIHDFSDLNLINQRSAESLSYEFKTFDMPSVIKTI